MLDFVIMASLICAHSLWMQGEAQYTLIVTLREYAVAGLSDCFCPSVCLSFNNIEIPFQTGHLEV